MQTSLAVADGAITGTLKYLSTGALATDWGAGNFMALGYTETDTDVTEILVGMNPSVSSGLLPLDSDMDSVTKVTDKDKQVLVTVEMRNGFACPTVYDLSGLTCNNS